MQPQDKIESLLPAYLDGELDEPCRRQVEAALDHSAEQRELLTALTQTRRMLTEDKNNLGQHPAPPPAPAEIQQMIRQWQKQPTPRQLDPHPWFLPWLDQDNITGEPTGRGRKLVLAGIGLAATFALTITIISVVLLGQRTPTQVGTNGNPTSPTTGQGPTATAAPLPTPTASPTSPVSTIPTVNKLATGKHSAPVTHLAWSPDGKYLATGSKNEEVFVWDSAGKQVGTLFGANTKSQGVTSLAWSADGQILAMGTSDDSFYFSKDGDPTSKGVIQYIGNYIYGSNVLLAFSPDNKMVAAGFDKSGTFMVFPRLGKGITTNTDYANPNENYTKITSLTWSPDSKVLAMGWNRAKDGVVRLFNPDGSLIKELKPLPFEPQFLSWSPDGALLAVAFSHGGGQIWTEQGTLVKEFTGFDGSFSDLAWSPDGKTLAGAYSVGQIRLWDKQGQLLQTFETHGGASKLAWSSDGTYLATGLSNGHIQLWNNQGKQALDISNSPSEPINGLAWQPGGQTLASISADQSVVFWSADLPNQHIKVPAPEPPHPLYEVTASPTPSTPPTSPQWPGGGMAYDPVNQQVILFGGMTYEPMRPLSDTWGWDGKTWVQLHTAHSPSPRSQANMVYDASRKQLVLFGGSTDPLHVYNDTWVWNGQDWVELHPAHSPPPRTGAALVYDAAHQQVLLWGGSLNDGQQNTDLHYFNDTWVWNGQDWTQKPTSTAPSPRFGAQIAYDALHQKVILFGGWGLVNNVFDGLNDTWAWDGKQWTKLRPATNPPAMISPLALVYDEKLKRLVLLGGEGVGGTLVEVNQVWVWDGQNWIANYNKTTPSADKGKRPYAEGWPPFYYGVRQSIMFVTFGVTPDDTHKAEIWLLSNGTTWQKQ